MADTIKPNANPKLNGDTFVFGLDMEQIKPNIAQRFHGIIRAIGGENLAAEYKKQMDELKSRSGKAEQLVARFTGNSVETPDEVKSLAANMLAEQLETALNKMLADSKGKDPRALAIKEATEKGLSGKEGEQYITDRVQLVQLAQNAAKEFPESMKGGKITVDIKPADVDRILAHMTPQAKKPDAVVTGPARPTFTR